MFHQRAHAGGLMDMCKPGMDHSFDKLKRPPAWASILGILSLVMGFFSQLSGAGNTGEERDFFRRPFPVIVALHARGFARFAPRKPAKKKFDAISITFFYSAKLDAFDDFKGQPPAFSGEKVALVMVSSLALMIGSLQVRISLLQIVTLVVIGSQVRVKRHGEGQSSSGATGGSEAGSMGGSRGGGGEENGRIGREIGEGRRNGMGGGAQRRGNEDDDDNDGRHMVGNVENERNPRPEDIANTFLPIILQSIAIITAIDGAQLSTTGTVIRSLSMIINLAAFICCTAVLGPLRTNPRVARILNPRIAGILSSIGSALAVLGFMSMMAIYLPF